MTTERAPIECWLTDMDGVLVHEEKALPGAADLLDRLVEKQRRFPVLTNNSIFTPRDWPPGWPAPVCTSRRSPSGPRRWRRRTSWRPSCRTVPRTSSVRPA